MTKEELEKEAEENSFRYTLDKPWACEVERKQIMAHFEKGYLAGAEPREKRIAELEDKLANADYQLEGRNLEIKELEMQLKREKNLSQCMSDHNEQLRELIQKMKCCKEEIIKALKECLDYEWLHAHNGQAKYLYLGTVIDIVNEKFEEIKEK